MLDDVSIDTLHAALNGLASRQRAISDDIANVNTPFFRARSVTFEGNLKQAVESGKNPLLAEQNVVFSPEPVGLTYSNVDLAAETISSVNTQLAYELVLRATGDRFTILRTAGKAV
ncbi:MAG: flagellar basal-body rod protein FlgB [Actinomycetota bacterium]|nr:flagellar basal-body rod protein FlgB [Actinomycetota bacterium]